MTFVQQVLSTFIGALAGFIFSIVLFYLTEKWKRSRENKNLRDNIQRELDFNINFLEEYKEEFEKIIRQITINDKQIYTIFKFSMLQRLFILEAFNKGLLYKYLSRQEIKDLDAMLNYFTTNMDLIHINYVKQYISEESPQLISLRMFEFNKGLIEKYYKLLLSLKDKLNKIC